MMKEKHGWVYNCGGVGCRRRNWSELPDLALDSILSRLPSIPDVLSLSSVCRSWRSLVYSSDLQYSLPPLLLLPQLFRTSHPDWPSQSPRSCRLRALALRTRLPTSPLTSHTLSLPFLGCSRGRLVLLSPSSSSSTTSSSTILLVDVFTGRLHTRIRSPPLVDYLCPRVALLTDSDLILACARRVLAYRFATASWSYLRKSDVTALLEFRGQVLCLRTRLYSEYVLSTKLGVPSPVLRKKIIKLGVLEFTGFSIGYRHLTDMHLLPLYDPYLYYPYGICPRLAFRLVKCGHELFLLRFVRLRKRLHVREVHVFKLDLEKQAWTEVESIGDWCLFVDSVGSSVVSCPHPARWGGRSNSLYVARPQCDSWIVVPLDRGHRFDFTDVGIFNPNPDLPHWPSSVWVYPN